MGSPAAKKNDKVMGLDVHMNASNVVASFPFDGLIAGDLSSTVRVEGQPAALKDSVANNTTGHISGAGPASNKGQITRGSSSVFFDGKPAARAGDPVKTCNDPQDLETSFVVATSKVFIGG
jgi:uncharacterized Zn-binding protein involved in type VI secretion